MSRESPLTLRPEKSSLYRSAITIYLFWVYLYRVCVCATCDPKGSAGLLPSMGDLPQSHTAPLSVSRAYAVWQPPHGRRVEIQPYGGRLEMSLLIFYHSAVWRSAGDVIAHLLSLGCEGLGWCGVDRLGPRGLGMHALAGRRRVDGAVGGDFAYTRAVE